MKNENRNEEAVSPVIATILMVAITVVLAGVLYVWASSLADDSKGGGLDKYNFEARDATGTMSDSGGDDLVYVKMTGGDEPLSWSVLKVTITVENADGDQGPSLTCAESTDADAGDAPCVWTKPTGADDWEVSDEITISEGANTDLCDGVAPDGGCDMVITLTKEAVGSDDGGLLRNVDGYAEA